MEEKNTARDQVLAQREAIPAESRARKSAAICKELVRSIARGLDAGQCVPAGERPLISVYSSMGSEVCLDEFAREAQQRGWDVCYPCMVRLSDPAADRRAAMGFYCLPEGMADARQAAFLAHPARACDPNDANLAQCRAVQPKDIDVAVVPVVAFDRTGARLGYGGGNYDRLLPQLRPDAYIVGVAFEEQCLPCVPTEPHDRPLPRIISS